MHERITKAIELNAEQITNKLLQEVHEKPETWHYMVIQDEVVADRIFHVIRNISSRLGNWLKKNEPKERLFSYYTFLGSERCRQCIPLEALISVLLMIRREILKTVGNQLALETGTGTMAEAVYQTNLFFVRVVQSAIAGYRNQADLISQARKTKKRKPLV